MVEYIDICTYITTDRRGLGDQESAFGGTLRIQLHDEVVGYIDTVGFLARPHSSGSPLNHAVLQFQGAYLQRFEESRLGEGRERHVACQSRQRFQFFLFRLWFNGSISSNVNGRSIYIKQGRKERRKEERRKITTFSLLHQKLLSLAFIDLAPVYVLE